MISIIICSRGPEFRKAVTENIAATIGVPYEIVAVDNSEDKYGICAAYNVGAARSVYDILCFAHEDIAFRTEGWGRIVEQVLLDNSIGAIGATGGKWLADAPGTWHSCGNKYLSSNILDESPKGEYRLYTYSNPENKSVVDVAAVDGLWICARKNVWKKYPFDEKTFPGFHFYDVDFCANMFHEYRVCVALEIGVTHFSLGNYNDLWFTYADIFYRKHTHQLPLGIPQLSARDTHLQEYNLTKAFLQAIFARKLSAKMGYKYLVKCIKLEPFNRHTLWLVRQYAKLVWQNSFREVAGQGFNRCIK